MTGIVCPAAGTEADSANAATGVINDFSKVCSSASGSAANVRYTKKVSFGKIRKKLKGQSSTTIMYTKNSSKESRLTCYGFYFNVWKIPHVGYGDEAETITLYPVIKAKKKGSSSTLSLGILFNSNVKVHSKTKRKYKKMTISGGGQKFTISGSTSTKRKHFGEFVGWKIFTKGTFTISKNSKVNLSRLEKLEKIMSSNNPTIKFKDSVKKKTYKCSIGSLGVKNMKSMIKKYKKLLKYYQKK